MRRVGAGSLGMSSIFPQVIPSAIMVHSPFAIPDVPQTLKKTMNTKRSLIQICLLGALLLQAFTSGAQTATKIAGGGYHSLFLKSHDSLWGMGYNLYGQSGNGSHLATDLPGQILAGLAAGFNQISVRPLSNGNQRLSYVGLAGTNYALDRAFKLSPSTWVPQVTNPAGAGGVLVIPNTPNRPPTISGAPVPCRGNS
jgi:Regulator of chromosome condensation (RCC1) repeat